MNEPKKLAELQAKLEQLGKESEEGTIDALEKGGLSPWEIVEVFKRVEELTNND